MFMFTHIYMHMNIHMYRYSYTYIMYLHICTCIPLDHTHINTCALICTHIHKHTDTYTHIDTHIHGVLLRKLARDEVTAGALAKELIRWKLPHLPVTVVHHNHAAFFLFLLYSIQLPNTTLLPVFVALTLCSGSGWRVASGLSCPSMPLHLPPL